MTEQLHSSNEQCLGISNTKVFNSFKLVTNEDLLMKTNQSINQDSIGHQNPQQWGLPIMYKCAIKDSQFKKGVVVVTMYNDFNAHRE